ncbi:MAG: hypothetical protein K0U86_05425 [Planctomycetes bacterium]|nr:hypothetical protein [Planctomycetota bacterium]MCH9724329.1 hypothetical protein [Planctomycetota bacterium]MCH9777348.1 hypothetical protein [Planctomycetota bacterium]MDF1742172.1 hypothetical protein [Gimesia sp.]
MIHRLHSIQINQAAARRILMVVLLVFVCLQGVPTSLPAQDKPKAPEQAKIEVYAAPTALELKMQLQNWAADQKTKNPAELKSIARLLVKLDSPLSPEQKLALTLQVFSELNPEAKQLVQAYQLSDKLPQLSSHPLLVNGKAETFYLSNIRYYVARNLTQFRMVDQALELFTSIKPDELIDPAGYLFYKAVCEHHLLQKEACGKTLDLLLNNTEQIPERYTQVAILMQADLAELKDESLDEISRKMSDVERRLELGNSGKKVQKVEDEIIASLDKLIKKMEDQSKKGSSSGAGAGSSNSPDGGSSESRVKGQTAPGEVDKKKLSNNGGWGDLPPKKQASAKNIINRNFPSHYRKAVEKYFKKLATQKANTGK